MRVKKYIAESIIEALTEIKRELGPDAIILSTKEEKRVYGQPQKYTVVAAVREQDLQRKEVTEKKLGHFTENFEVRSAAQQKAIIGSVVDGIKRRHAEKNPIYTSTRYIEIDDNVAPTLEAVVPEPIPTSSRRVQNAVKEALQSSMKSNFFGFGGKKADPEPVLKPQPAAPPNVVLADFQKRPEKMIITERAVSPELKTMGDKLVKAGVESQIITQYLEQAERQYGSQVKKATIEAFIARKILDSVQCVVPGHFQGIEFFVGPEGTGKTSALVKLASHYIMNYKRRVAIVTTDLKKVGAVEQLKVYSRILNVPVIAVSSIEEWGKWVSKLEGYDNVLVDTPGISMAKADEIEFLRSLTNVHGRLNKRTHLVLSAMSSTSDLNAIANRFKVAKYNDVIFTKIDQTIQHGVLLNFFTHHKLPFHSFGLSSDVIDGFEWATRERILDLIFRLTKLNGARSYGQVL